jgi:hypothetical protein
MQPLALFQESPSFAITRQHCFPASVRLDLRDGK